MNTEKLIDDAVTAFADREIPAPSRDHLRIALNAFEASLTRCGCDACTVARRERTGLTEHDRAAVARVLHEIVYAPGANYDRAVPGIQEHMLACAEKVAAGLPWIVPTPAREYTYKAPNGCDDDYAGLPTFDLEEAREVARQFPHDGDLLERRPASPWAPVPPVGT